jgi:hypothetical protein
MRRGLALLKKAPEPQRAVGEERGYGERGRATKRCG